MQVDDWYSSVLRAYCTSLGTFVYLSGLVLDLVRHDRLLQPSQHKFRICLISLDFDIVICLNIRNSDIVIYPRQDLSRSLSTVR